MPIILLYLLLLQDGRSVVRELIVITMFGHQPAKRAMIFQTAFFRTDGSRAIAQRQIMELRVGDSCCSAGRKPGGKPSPQPHVMWLHAIEMPYINVE